MDGREGRRWTVGGEGVDGREGEGVDGREGRGWTVGRGRGGR